MPAAASVGALVGRLREEARARRELVALTAIVAVAAVVRFATLGHQSFDSGETITAARILNPSLAATMDAVATVERSGPAYYALAWVWAKLFGTSEVALRSLSATVGTATIVAVFLAARELLSSRAALVAAGLAAVCPDLVWYSQEARSYPLLVLLTTLGLYFFVRSVRRPSRAPLAAWAACSALALATHYFSVFVVAPEAAWLVLARVGGRRSSRVAVAAVATAGLALLPLAIAQEGTGRANGFTTIPVLERGVSALVKFMAGEGPSTSGQWAALPMPSRALGLLALAACALAIAIAVARGAARERRAVAIVGGIGAFAFAAPLTLALAGQDYVEPRNLLGSLVPLLIVVAAGVDVASRARPRRRAPRPALGILLGGAFATMVAATALSPRLQRDDWRGISRLITAEGPAGVVLTQPPSAGKPLGYYLGRPLDPLDQTDFPCGVRSRTIVTLSRDEPDALPGSEFRLVSTAETAQRWRIAAYHARRPVRLDVQELRILNVLHGDEAPRVDAAAPVEPRPLPANLASGPRAAPSPHAACTGPGIAVRLDRS